MTFKNNDIEKAEKQLAALDRVVMASLPEAAKAGAAELEEEAVRRAPVRTAKLKNSFGNRPGNASEKIARFSASHVVFNTAFYAAAVEKGRYKRPFMRPAAQAARGAIGKAIENTVTRKTDRVI